MAEVAGLLVKVRGDGKAFAQSMAGAFSVRSIEIEPILRLPPQDAAPSLGLAATQPMTWLRVANRDAGTVNGWDAAHALLGPDGPFAATGASGVETIEPDLAQGWFDGGPEAAQAAANEADFCAFEDQSDSGGQAKGPVLAWNFNDDFSGLDCKGSVSPQYTLSDLLFRLVAVHFGRCNHHQSRVIGEVDGVHQSL
jgi:hypothetical protein